MIQKIYSLLRQINHDYYVKINMNPQARQPELKNGNNKVEASAGEVSISGWVTGCRGTRMEGGDELFRAAFAGAKGAGLQFAGHATPHTTPHHAKLCHAQG